MNTQLAFAYLLELSKGWDVTINSFKRDDLVEWHVTIDDHRDRGPLLYYGTNLERVIQSAWAGERPGRVS